MVSHVHGAHTGPESDGYAEAWWLPDAQNLAGYVTKGSRYDQYDRSNTTPGSAVFQYPNTQRAASIWYHDHTLGMTRLNVYAGPAGFWMIRGGAGDLPAGVLPSGKYEVPIAIQDRAFYEDGSLFYPDTRTFFDGFAGPYIPASTGVPPIWQPEFFGSALMVNAKTWPVHTVEPRRYRFRILNGCGSRFLILKIVANDPSGSQPSVQDAPALPMHVVGADTGFLPSVTTVDQLLMSPAERFDVVVDFSRIAPGTELYLVNEGPDEPYGGGVPGVDFAIADALTTRQVMKIVVGPAGAADTSDDPTAAGFSLPTRTPLPAATASRKVSLNEAAFTDLDDGGNVLFDGPVAAMLGTVDPITSMPMPMMWSDIPTETPYLGATEEWDICNFTMDAHPIHLHQVEFEVVGRTPMDTDTNAGQVVCRIPTGDAPLLPPHGWETGTKDTVIAYPGEITRIRARFDLPGLYQWHCHIVEHEDNEMMRPLDVVTTPAVPLGELSRWAVTAGGLGNITINGGSVVGGVATGKGAKLETKSTVTLDELRMHTGASFTRSTATRVVGGVTRADQSGVLAAMVNARNVAAAVPGTAMPAVKGARTVAGTPGLNVLTVPSIQLSGASAVLTLQGTSATQFVVNVTGAFSVQNGASIQLVGVLPSQVLVNLTGANRELLVSGGSIAGTYLDADGPANLSACSVNGAVHAGRSVQLKNVTIRRV